ncbi:MAG: alpha/beta fold hydrolase, partial [Planctomycetes bacterium]|nr:alpha/beta fold hydrolase [Planctomycetota bacterium]
MIEPSRLLSRQVLLADRLLYATPEALGLDAEDVVFWTEDGVRLRGWFVRGAKRGTVVFCSGNSANVSAHLEYVRLAARTGCSVLAFDYRGFGRSDGVPDLRAIRRDVEAACELAGFQSGGEPFALFGISIGAQAALAAAGRGAAGAAAVAAEGVSDVRAMLAGLFAEGAFGPRRVSTIDGPGGGLAARPASSLPGPRLPAPLARAAARLCAALYPFDGRSLAGLAERLGPKPVLLVHGVEDPLLPFEAAIDLQDLLTVPASLWLIPGVGHAQEPALACGAEYAARLGDLLDGAFWGGASAPPRLDVTCSRLPGGPGEGCRTRLVVARPAGEAGPRPLLVSAWGGGVLRQAVLEGGGPLEIELPGRVEGVSSVPAPALEPDPTAVRYREGGYRPLFRRLAAAASARDLEDLDAALADALILERWQTFDLLAGVYAVRAAQGALGIAPGFAG